MQIDPATSAPVIEGVDGSSVLYRERLLPGFFTWLLIAFMTASLGVAYGYVFGTSFGVTLALASTLAIYFVLYLASPVIVIDELVLRVGDARLPRKFVGSPTILDIEQTRKSTRLPTHRDAYLTLRAAISESVLIEVTDVTDPHPYWQFSSRDPQKLVEALELQTNE